jgi:hypothetical protein
MRISIFTTILAAMFCTVGCSSTTVTHQQLVQRMGTSFPYAGSHFLYMGSKDGFDYVTHTWEDFRGTPGSRMFRLRTGELRVGQQVAFTTDSTRWREIDIYTR